MSPIIQKINNSYESEPSSSGNSNGVCILLLDGHFRIAHETYDPSLYSFQSLLKSSIDTLTMNNHASLDASPKLNILLGLGGENIAAGPMVNRIESPQATTSDTVATSTSSSSAGATSDIVVVSGHDADNPTAGRNVVISEAADRQRVELAKIYFQRVFAESQQQHQQQQKQMLASHDAHTTPTNHGPLKSAAGYADSSDSSHSFATNRDNTMFTQADNCNSTEISDQDVKCRQQLAALNANTRAQQVYLPPSNRNENDDADDDDDDDLSNVSVYSIEPSSSRNEDDNNDDDDDGDDDTITNAIRFPAMYPMHTLCDNDDAVKRPTMFVAENSCNAVDHQIADPDASTDTAVQSIGVATFDGCIPRLSISSSCVVASREHHDQKMCLLAEVERRSSSNCMQTNNEQSPDLFEEEDNDDDEDDDNAADDDDDECSEF